MSASILEFPFSPGFLREVRQSIEICASKIQNEWTYDNRHFDNQQHLIHADQLRDVETQDLADASSSQPFIYRDLAPKGFGSVMHFDCSFSGFDIVFGQKNDTVNAEAQSLGDAKLMLRRVNPGVLDE